MWCDGNNAQYATIACAIDPKTVPIFGATGSCAFGGTRRSRSALLRAASPRISAVCTARLRSDRPLTEAQRSSNDRYRSDDTRPFRSPRLTSTFQPPARAGCTGTGAYRQSSATGVGGHFPRPQPVTKATDLVRAFKDREAQSTLLRGDRTLQEDNI